MALWAIYRGRNEWMADSELASASSRGEAETEAARLGASMIECKPHGHVYHLAGEGRQRRWRHI